MSQLHRESVLTAIRASLAKVVLPDARYEPPARPSPPTREVPTDPADLRAAFVAELQALSGQVYSPADHAEAMDILLDVVRGCEAEVAIAWDEAYLPLPGVWEALAAAGVRVLDSTLPPSSDEPAHAARLAELEQATVGVTGALAGLADTGSLALPSGPGRGRLASLLPPVHVALLPVARIVPTMAAFFASHPNVVRRSSNLVFVSGPSRTADIEQTLTLGVHGPRELHVVLLASAL